ncbi:MAG TPA: transglycosylase SLT domain-containing protein, partial [Blastocatellia bacterium]|nr:transglycosylase SLT domain-containing protein [Blastocatellia bacterium]
MGPFEEQQPQLPQPQLQQPQEITLEDWEERVRSNYGIPQKLWRGMAEQESEGDVNAVSPTGVRGKWGMTRATAKIYNYNRDDPFEQAAAAGKHLRTMYDKLGHIKNDDARWWGAIASYYGGEGAVDRDGKLSTTSLDGISNPMEHVNRVAKRIQQFGETPASSGAPAQSLGQTPAQQPMKPVASPSVGRRLPQLSPERRKQQEDVLYEWAKATNPPNAQITEARRLLSAMSDQVFQQALKEGGKRIPGKVFRRATLVESLQSQFEPDGKPTEADRRIEQRRAERAKMSPFRRLYEDFSEGGAETINRVLDTASDTGESLARALTGDFGPVSEMGREALATTRATLSRLSRGGAAGMAAGPEYEKLAKQAEAEQAAKAAEVARQRVERQTALPGEAGQAARLREQMRQQVSESRAATPDMSGRIVRGVGGALADPVMLAGPLGGTRAMLAATALTQDPRDPAQALLNVGGAAASIGAARRVAGNVASRTAGLSSRAQTAAQMAAAVPVGSVTNIGQEAVGQALRGKFDPQQLVEAGVTGAILSGQDAAEIAGARRARNALVDPQRMALEDRGTLETRLRPSSPDTAKLQQPPAIGAQSEVEAAVAQAREAAAASGRPVEGKLWEAQERRIRESFGEAQAAQERAKLIEARLAELEQGQESGQPKPLSVAEQRQQERVRLFEVSRTIANRSLEQANAAMEAGDFIEAQAQLEGYRRALRDQSRYAPTDSPGARSQAAKEIARADTLAAKVKAQAAAQRRLEDAPTSGLPARRSRPTEQPQTEQPQSPGSSPLLGSVVNPEGGVPQAPEALSGRFGALVRQQTTQAASAPASRRKDTGELSPISYLKRKTGGEGIRVSDRGEAAVLGAREAGIVGLTNKRSRWTVNDAAVMLDEGGYTLPDGRAFTDPSVTENDVLAYLSGGGKQGRMNTTGLDQRLADEEAEYYARALEDQAPSQRFSETGALEELGDFFGAMARDETPRAGGIDPDLMSAYNKLDTDDPAEISQILRDADKRFKKSATIPERNASVAAFEKVRQLTIAEQEALSRVIPERVFAPVREGYQGEPGETYSRAVQDIPASEANAQLDKNLRDVLDFFDEMKASEAPETKKPPKFVEDAAQRLKDAASGKRAGSGGQQLADAAIVAGWRVYEAGMDFAEWSRGVISQLGDAVRPHLERAWQQLQRDYRRMASEARTPRSEPGDEPGLRIEDEMARLRTGKDSPVQLRQLRRRLPDMSKEEFDNAVMDLAESNRIVLHAHDFPASETPENLEQYVRSGDRYFTGAVFRSDVKPRRASILAALDDSSPFAARRAWVGVANSLERAGLLDYDDILVWDKDVREAGHSQKAIDAVWDVLAEIRADNYLSEAQVTFRPGGRNRPGYLYVNDAGAEMLRGAFDAADIAPPDFTYQSAVNADAEIMAMAANSLREEAQGSTIRPEEAEKLNRFADEIEKAVEAGGSSILPSRHMQTARAAKVAIRHETFHSSQRRVGDLHALTAPEWFGQHRYAERIGERLTQLGYPEVEHPAE